MARLRSQVRIPTRDYNIDLSEVEILQIAGRRVTCVAYGIPKYELCVWVHLYLHTLVPILVHGGHINKLNTYKTRKTQMEGPKEEDTRKKGKMAAKIDLAILTYINRRLLMTWNGQSTRASLLAPWQSFSGTKALLFIFRRMLYAAQTLPHEFYS